MSYGTHIAVYCAPAGERRTGCKLDGGRCRGHLKPRPVEDVPPEPFTMPAVPKPPTAPMATPRRIGHYAEQNRRDGRRKMTSRQRRQIRRMQR